MCVYSIKYLNFQDKMEELARPIDFIDRTASLHQATTAAATNAQELWEANNDEKKGAIYATIKIIEEEKGCCGACGKEQEKLNRKG